MLNIEGRLNEIARRASDLLHEFGIGGEIKVRRKENSYKRNLWGGETVGRTPTSSLFTNTADKKSMNSPPTYTKKQPSGLFYITGNWILLKRNSLGRIATYLLLKGSPTFSLFPFILSWLFCFIRFTL